jgi:benzoate membrane transport protein
MQRIPLSIASALLAGVLLRFALDAFAGLETAFAIVAPMVVLWMVARRYLARYCIPLVLVVGTLAAVLAGRLDMPPLGVGQPWPVPIVPGFQVSALLGVAIPLFVVTMASQNVPGVAVLRAHGYEAPVSGLVTLTGAVTMLLAPFGVFAVNLAAITAAICMGDDAHPDPRRRWLAASCAGGFYLLLALFAASLVDVFAAFPRELVIGIAGLALMPTIAAGLTHAMGNAAERDPALLTFVVTASGLTLAGIGSAFWAVVLGVALRVLTGSARRV